MKSPFEPRSGSSKTVVPHRKGDGFYNLAAFFVRTVMGLTSRSLELNADRTQRQGGLLLVSNHIGPYDVACLITASRRPLDFISINRFGDKPFVGWLFRNLNVVFLRREGGLTDSATFKEAIKRLRKGKIVTIFPEAEMREPGTQASHTGDFHSGFGKMALLGRVPILPAAVLDTNHFSRPTGWLPWPKATWGVNFGETIPIPEGRNSIEAASLLEAQWLSAVTELEKELRVALDKRFG